MADLTQQQPPPTTAPSPSSTTSTTGAVSTSPSTSTSTTTVTALPTGTPLTAYGLTVTVPPRWEGRIYVRPEAGEVGTYAFEGQAAPEGERTNPLLQVASVVMPADVGDFGGGLVETLGATDIFVVIKEFSPASATTKMFARKGMPLPLDPAQFSTSSLQRARPGQAGVQVFFNEQGGAYCLYAVIGSFALRDTLVPQITAVLQTVRFTPR